MPKKTYVVELTSEERRQLRGLVRTGKAAGYKRRHAHLLLKADAGAEGPAWTDARIAEALDVGTATVERVRKRFVTEGLEAALRRQPSCRVYQRLLDGRAEAHLIALPAIRPSAEFRYNLTAPLGQMTTRRIAIMMLHGIRMPRLSGLILEPRLPYQ